MKGAKTVILLRIARAAPLFLALMVAYLLFLGMSNACTETKLAPSATVVHPTPAIAGADADMIVATFESSQKRIFERILPSSVTIEALRRVTSYVYFGQFELQLPEEEPQYEVLAGAGFVWDDKGHIVTGNHIVEDAEIVVVTFPTGREAYAKIVGTDFHSDLAVLRVDVLPSEATPAILGDSDLVAVGDFAMAIGNPFHQGFTFTTGVVSGLNRIIAIETISFAFPGAIQTDAAINPGNSGGPLVNRKGEVIGINMMFNSDSGFSSGVGLAIPINAAKRIVPDLIQHGSFAHAWLGIVAKPLTLLHAPSEIAPTDTRGLLILEVVQGSPAQEAGLLPNDIIQAINGINGINGTSTYNAEDYLGYLERHTRPGDTVTLNVLREGKEIQVEAELDARPEPGSD